MQYWDNQAALADTTELRERARDKSLELKNAYDKVL
jgi:hypothetical protein